MFSFFYRIKRTAIVLHHLILKIYVSKNLQNIEIVVTYGHCFQRTLCNIKNNYLHSNIH